MTTEVKERVDRIMEYCHNQADIYNNFQLGTKVVINGIYGAFGFSGFYFYNPNIAESVTKQGKNAIKYAEKLTDMYFQKKWHLDEKTHNLMGIHMKPGAKVTKSVCVYQDTDSQYSSFQEVIPTTDWFEHKVWRLTTINKSNDQKDFVYVSSGRYKTEESAKEYFKVDEINTDKYLWSIDTIEPGGREFSLTFDRVFLHDFFVMIFDKYAEKNCTPNILNFELEAYNEAGIWLAKKKYIKNTTWTEPNVYYESCEKIKPTGVEIAQTSSSPWVKKQMTDLIKWIFRQETFTLDGFCKELVKVKKSFMQQSEEIISLNKGMNKYDDYVMGDTTEIELHAQPMVTVQGAAFYNWLLNNNERFKRKYNTLVNADKLCVLYIKPTPRYTYWKECNLTPAEYAKNRDKYRIIDDTKVVKTNASGNTVTLYKLAEEKCLVEAFSYPAGQFPREITTGFEIDYEHMFELLILQPMNRIVEAMGFQPINIDMTYEASLW